MTTAPKYDVYQAIADPIRRQVLEMLTSGDLSIKAISHNFSVSRTAVVKHLHVLTEAKLVSGRKAGREKLYSLEPEQLVELKQWLSFFDQYWDNKISMLKHYVEKGSDNE